MEGVILQLSRDLTLVNSNLNHINENIGHMADCLDHVTARLELVLLLFDILKACYIEVISSKVWHMFTFKMHIWIYVSLHLINNHIQLLDVKA